MPLMAMVMTRARCRSGSWVLSEVIVMLCASVWQVWKSNITLVSVLALTWECKRVREYLWRCSLVSAVFQPRVGDLLAQ